nr:hypothetical protein HK105_003755 [Polyrhizophydium stewartii]
MLSSSILAGLYAAECVATALLTMTAFASTRHVRGLIPRALSRKRLAQASTFVTEFPQSALVGKLAMVAYCMSNGVFELPGMTALYWFDVLLCLVLWGLFLQAYFARYPVYEQTKFYRNSTISFWFRFLNPMWEASSRHLAVYESICYATPEEIEEAGVKAKYQLSLDIFHHSDYPKNRPVLIYVHGGSYRGGSKDSRPPLLSYMALKKYIVVAINYRLSPSVNYPTHVIDVKRAIRWVRNNISLYGGDPSFITLVGVSSGGHLATMVALTSGERKYQPGFEDADVSVQAVVSISGVYDLTNFKNHFGFNLKGWFSREVAGQQADDQFFRDASPTRRLKDAETKMHLTAATPEEKQGIALPPFMVIHGQADSLAPISHVREFTRTFKQVTKAELCYIELPSANHLFPQLSTPRGHYIAYGIEPFVRAMYERHVAAQKAK